MKILYIFHGGPDGTVEDFMREQEKGNEIVIFDLRGGKDYSLLLDMIEASDRVISW
ncbi:MAG: hypothetical protein P8013_13020 [Candidatus Sulfobium sp.]|jgi:hypothetical protein